MTSIEIPSPAVLRALREELGLSQNELAMALGLGRDGARIVRSWEAGYWKGDPFTPTGPAWAAFRYLVAIKKATDDCVDLSNSTRFENLLELRTVLPESMR